MIAISQMLAAKQVDRWLKPLFKGMIFLLGGVGLQLCAQRPDVVVMKNGDRFTCTVNRLKGRLLYIETDYLSGSIGLEDAAVGHRHNRHDFLQRSERSDTYEPD